MRPVQYFTDEYLEQCKHMKPEQIARFLDDFRRISSADTMGKSKLISLKVPEDLLQTFRNRCELEGKRYQTQIKNLMTDWLLGEIKK